MDRVICQHHRRPWLTIHPECWSTKSGVGQGMTRQFPIEPPSLIARSARPPHSIRPFPGFSPALNVHVVGGRTTLVPQDVCCRVLDQPPGAAFEPIADIPQHRRQGDPSGGVSSKFSWSWWGVRVGAESRAEARSEANMYKLLGRMMWFGQLPRMFSHRQVCRWRDRAKMRAKMRASLWGDLALAMVELRKNILPCLDVEVAVVLPTALRQ